MEASFNLTVFEFYRGNRRRLLAPISVADYFYTFRPFCRRPLVNQFFFETLSFGADPGLRLILRSAWNHLLPIARVLIWIRSRMSYSIGRGGLWF